MHFCRLVITFALALVIGAVAQDAPSITSTGRVGTIEEALQKHHVGLTRSALLKPDKHYRTYQDLAGRAF